jgi:outer membrane protein W
MRGASTSCSRTTDALSGFAQLAISDVKDEGEVEYFNQYTGQSYTPGKINRLLLIPLTFGMQYRLFKDDIVDNFRPYVSAGVGPSAIFVSPYSDPKTITDPLLGTYTYYEQIDFFKSLKKGHLNYTLGIYVGAGAYFGLDKGTLTGVSIRYYYIPYRPGIESLEGVRIKRFGGFFITLNFGSLY